MIVGNVQYRGSSTKEVVLPDRVKQVKKGEWVIVHLNKARELVDTGDFLPDEDTQKLFMQFDGNYRERQNVNGMLKGKKCFLIGGGPSLKNFDFSLLDDHFTIAINHSVIFYPNAKACLFLDGNFLDKNENEARKFLINYRGMIFCSFRTEYHKENGNAIPFYVNKDQVSNCFTRGIYGSRLSGMAALSLAIIMKPEKIYLLGYDLDECDKNKHFYDEGKSKYNNEGGYKGERVKNHIKSFKVYIPFKDKIINLNQESKILYFEFQTLEQALK